MYDVLVVDDDDAIVAFVGEVLTQEELTWQSCHNGEEALATLARERFRALLLDLSMPLLDGYEVLAHLQAHQLYPSMPILIFSATAHDGNLRALGAHAVIRKPCSIDQLVRPLRAAMNGVPPDAAGETRR